LREITDPNFTDEEYDIEKVQAFYSVEIKQVADEIGEGLFAAKPFEPGHIICNLNAIFVRKGESMLGCNETNEYIIPGPLPPSLSLSLSRSL